MTEEWFVMPRCEAQKFHDWLLNHPHYGFKQPDPNETFYINSMRTIHNAQKGDVSCKIRSGENEQIDNILVTFTFKDGTLDEGLLGLIRQNFAVLDSRFY